MMKKLFSILVALALSVGAMAQVSKTVNVATAGTLSTLLTAAEKTTITHLTLTGNIDARDVKCMRDDMTVLQAVDMGAVSIVEYVGNEGTNNPFILYFANEMPQYAFYQTTLQSIVLPSTITSIDEGTFSTCSRLTGDLLLSNQITYIGNYAFSDCQHLASITNFSIIPQPINSSVFQNVPKNIVLTVPTSAVSKYQASEGWKDFNVVAGGYSVSAVPNYAAYGNVSGANNNKFYIAEESVTFVATPASGFNFLYWTCNGRIINDTPNLTFIINQDSNLVAHFGNIKVLNVSSAGTLSTLLTTTEKSMITHLTLTGNIDARDLKCLRDQLPSLLVLDIGRVSILEYSGSEGTCLNNTTYPANAMPALSFYNPNNPSSKVQSIVLPSGLTSIGHAAFAYCSNLVDTLSLPIGITSIASDAFSYCVRLKGNPSLPIALTSISSYTFFNCKGLTGNILIHDRIVSIGESAFKKCNRLTGDILLPKSLTSIGKSAFESCSGFNGSLLIPTGVRSIGDWAFYGCWGLSSITNMNAVPQIIGMSVFQGGALENITLIVPINAVPIYRTTEIWKHFNIIGGATVSAIPSNVAFGSVNHIEDRLYTLDEKVTIEATPAAGFNFTNWTSNGKVVSTSPALTFTVTQDTSLVANFKSTDATLASLTLSQGTLSPAFSNATTSYTVSVANSVTNITLTPTTTHAQATATGGGSKTLVVGDNTVTITVTAEDGTTTKTYIVTVTRLAKSTDATLASLTLSQGTLSPAFSSATTSYTVNVANSVTSISLTPTTTHAQATATGGGNKALVPGNNTVSITVTAEDGTTTKTYTITITRQQPTGISTAPKALLSVYPNPATDVLTIANGDYPAGTPVRMYTLGGSLVLQAVLSPGSHTALDITELAAGTYLVKVGKSSAKVLKQ